MLLQCYPPLPPGLFVPAEHRLAAAVCLVCLTRFLLLLAIKLRGLFFLRLLRSVRFVRLPNFRLA